MKVFSRPLQIAFLTGTLEPGRDGVGDYTRLLAEELARRGERVCLLALHDRFAAAIERAEIQTGGARLPVLRLPHTLGWPERSALAWDFLDEFQPDWVSVQLVSYGFDPKGVVRGLDRWLQPLTQGRSLHWMFHELWIGHAEEAGRKERLIGRVQKFYIKRLLARLAPHVIHTSNSTYAGLLAREGVRALELPLFGAVPVTKQNGETWLWPELQSAGVSLTGANREQHWLLGFFGSLHPVWPSEPLFSRLADAAAGQHKRVVLLSIGRLGPGEALWQNLAGQYGGRFAFHKLGERPAEQVSQFFNSIDFGIATSPLALIGKSASVAAMREHGLPVIVNREDVTFAGTPSSADAEWIRLDGDFSRRLAVREPRVTAGRLPAVASALLNALLDHTTPGDFQATLPRARSGPARQRGSARPLRILFSSHFFHPQIGGLEEVSRILAEEFVRLGHEVKLVTQTPDPARHSYPFEMHRRPGWRRLARLVRWCDVFYQNNVSLRTAWPLLFIRRPWIVTHATWTARANGQWGWQDRLKRFLFRFATNVAISETVARQLSVASLIFSNPYRAELFQSNPAIPPRRDRELAFLGRLVSDKGVDLLLKALAQLKRQGLTPGLTIIGTGPEEKPLRQQAQRLGLDDQVRFVGEKQDAELFALLNAHQILVVPSRWREPFGVVALEGIACGCVVAGSEGGGLKNTIGPCGVTFPNDDSQALAAALQQLLSQPALLKNCRAQATAHLARFQPAVVAKKYLELFASAVAFSRKNERG